MIQQLPAAKPSRRPGSYRTMALAAATRRTLQNPWFAAHDLDPCPLVAASTTRADAQLATRRR
ncbi:MAG: hypothetical protein H0V24_15645 [Chloroflexia bacterium]|nr:hypothetical protein [Chloroflexia bacterium]